MHMELHTQSIQKKDTKSLHTPGRVSFSVQWQYSKLGLVLQIKTKQGPSGELRFFGGAECQKTV